MSAGPSVVRSSGAIGRFELADTGTIFLDRDRRNADGRSGQIAARPARARIRAHCGTRNPIKSDVRVLQATNRDLQRSMREGGFRPDLFYRLNVFPIALPAPRRAYRRHSVADPFLRPKACPLVSASANRGRSRAERHILRLMQYTWPGNLSASWKMSLNSALILGSTLVLGYRSCIYWGSSTA